MPRLSLGLSANVKNWFFDRELVRRSLSGATREALSKAGALVRTIARRSMKYVTSLRQQARQIDAGDRQRMAPVPSSPPGQPPRAVRPHPWIREFLYYAYDPSAGSVVIGPMRLSSRVNVPAVHEYGATVTIRNRRRRVRKIGSGGEVDVRGGRVVYSRLRTAAQVARANRLNAELYGPMHRIATYAPRPFMGPALAVAQPSLPKFWATSVRAAG